MRQQNVPCSNDDLGDAFDYQLIHSILIIGKMFDTLPSIQFQPFAYMLCMHRPPTTKKNNWNKTNRKNAVEIKLQVEFCRIE